MIASKKSVLLDCPFLIKTFIALIPPLSWLFIINFHGKQFTASTIFLRCTSARLTILTKNNNNQTYYSGLAETSIYGTYSLLYSLSSSIEDTVVVIMYGLTLPFPAPLSDCSLILFQSDPTSF